MLFDLSYAKNSNSVNTHRFTRPGLGPEIWEYSTKTKLQTEFQPHKYLLYNYKATGVKIYQNIGSFILLYCLGGNTVINLFLFNLEELWTVFFLNPALGIF